MVFIRGVGFIKQNEILTVKNLMTAMQLYGNYIGATLAGGTTIFTVSHFK